MSIAIGGGSGVAWFPLGPHEVYRPAYRVSEGYVRQVNITHVSVTNINVTNVRYVNQNAASVTVVSHDAFVGARPVRVSQVAVPADVIVQGRVVGTTAYIAPERSSVMGRPQGTIAAPPSRFAERAVVVRTAPPPPPVSFAARREALQANPGRPLDPGTAEALRRTQPVRAPMVRQAPPVAPMAVARPRKRKPRGARCRSSAQRPAPSVRAAGGAAPAGTDNGTTAHRDRAAKSTRSTRPSASRRRKRARPGKRTGRKSASNKGKGRRPFAIACPTCF